MALEQVLGEAAVQGLQEREFELHGTHYTIRKLLPRQGFAVLEVMRPAINEALERVDVQGIMAIDAPMETKVGMVIARAVLALPPQPMQVAMKALFEQVVWVDKHRSKPVVLAGREDEAVKDPFDFYVLLARCYAVNFSQSLGELWSLTGALPSGPQPDTET